MKIKPWNTMQAMGFVSAPPAIFDLPSGQQVTRIRMCMAWGGQTKDGDRKEGLFLNVVVYPPSSVHLFQTITPGMTIFVEGELRAVVTKEGVRLMPELILKQWRKIAYPSETGKNPERWKDIVKDADNVELEKLEGKQ